MRSEELWALAGVLELPEVPHELDEEVPGVFVVGAAGVGHAQVFAPVGAPGALAGQPQLGVFALAGDDHGAQVLALGFELDGIVPDALPVALSRSREEAAAEQEEHRAGWSQHGVRRATSQHEGERSLLKLRPLLPFIGRADKVGGGGEQ